MIARGLLRLDAQDRERWTRLQKPADPCKWETSAGLQEYKEVHSWSKKQKNESDDAYRYADC